MTDRRHRREYQNRSSYLNFMYGIETTDESSDSVNEIDVISNHSVDESGILAVTQIPSSQSLQVYIYILAQAYHLHLIA